MNSEDFCGALVRPIFSQCLVLHYIYIVFPANTDSGGLNEPHVVQKPVGTMDKTVPVQEKGEGESVFREKVPKFSRCR